MDILVTKDNQQFVLYDHLLIVMRECVMNKAEATMMKYNEKVINDSLW